ncbi:MAG: HD-GYP domain-containing protein [Armatimonadota bacterium]
MSRTSDIPSPHAAGAAACRHYAVTVTVADASARKGASRDAFEARVLYLLDHGVWPLPSDDPITLDLSPGDELVFVTWEPSAAFIVGKARVASRPTPLTSDQARELAVYCAAQGNHLAPTRLRMGARLDAMDVWRRPVPATEARDSLPSQMAHSLRSEAPPPDIVRLTPRQYADLTSLPTREPERLAAPQPAAPQPTVSAAARGSGRAASPPPDIAEGPALLQFIVSHWESVDLSDELDIVETLPTPTKPGALTGVVCRNRKTGHLTLLVGAPSGADPGLVGHVLSEIGRLSSREGTEATGLIVCSAPGEDLRRAVSAAGPIEFTSLHLRLRPVPARDGVEEERLRAAVEGLGSWCAEAALTAARREGVSVSAYLGEDSPLWRKARAVAEAVDDRLPGARGHSARVSALVRAIAEDLGLSGEACDYIALAGLMYDVGMLVVPGSVAAKRESLTPREFSVVRRHADVGARLVQQFGVLSPIALGVRHHHERWDGAGYPGRLRGDDIPLLARMISIADGFDAMTSVRPYRPAKRMEEALNAVAEGAGRQWDAGLVESLKRAVNRVGARTRPAGRG